MFGTKESHTTVDKLQVLYNNMQRIEVKNAGKVWHEITNTIGNLVENKSEFDEDEYKSISDGKFTEVRAVIFEKGKERKQYIDAHKFDWPDVETQLNLISNDKRVRLIFK